MVSNHDVGEDPAPEVLVDFPPTAGLKDVSSKPEALAQRSAAALDSAMDAIRSMAARINSTTGTLTQRPSAVEVEFGIKLDAAAGALIARTGAEAHIVVKLTWNGE